MEYAKAGLVFVITALLVASTHADWQEDWTPNSFSQIAESQSTEELGIFEGLEHESDEFKLLLVEDDKAFVGAKNRLYYISLTDFKNVSVLQWDPHQVAVSTCRSKGKDECENYIRVVVRKDDGLLYVCGTNAYNPKCRHYQLKDNDFRMERIKENEGTGVCPFNPSQNSTAIFADGKLYSATVTDSRARDPLILQSRSESDRVRTPKGDSVLLNEPNFVSSFEKDDKVFFFFRETATENINCGKAIFSRVARVCKNDMGVRNNKYQFTSFFKARLNCSIPGNYPFYFDELQATSDFGQGNVFPTKYSGDRSDMVYGVFNTPDNSIRGSAVCAFRYSDIADTFQGKFKEQLSVKHNWLPVSLEDTPIPHPEQCTKSSVNINSLKFIKSHPLMNNAVPAQGGQPMLVFTSFKSRFTHIAVDWQVLAADGLYYDIVFVGTDDGRVIKSINAGTPSKMESVIIEDLQVLEKGEAVVGIKVISNRAQVSQQKLVIISSTRIVSLPLHRCGHVQSCSACVALQDPYCAWNNDLKKCFNSEKGLQNIQSGTHGSCEVEPIVEEPVETTPLAPVITKCECPEVVKSGRNSGQETDDGEEEMKPLGKGSDKDEDKEGRDGDTEAVVGASTNSKVDSAGVSANIVVIALVVAIILSLLLGFGIGFWFQSCRYSRDRENVFYPSSSLQRTIGRNRLSSGDSPYFHTDHTSLSPKKMNHVVNVKNGKVNSGVETVPVTKSNKVYV